MTKKRKKSKTIQASNWTIARALFYLNAFLWLVITFLTLVDMLLADNGLSMLLVGFFLLIHVTALFLSGKMLDRNKKWTYIFALVVVTVNSALTFTGFPDLLYVTALLLDAIILVVLISLRKHYFQ